MLTFSQWLAANKYDEANLTADMRKHLEAAWKAEVAAANPPPPLPKPKPEDKPATVEDKLAAYEAEATRQDFIRATCEAWAKENPYAGVEKLKQLRELQQIALDDQKMTQADFRYQMLRFDKTIGMMVTTPRQEQLSDDVVEAAICKTHGLRSPEKVFGTRTMEAVDKRFRGGLTLVGMVSLAARQNGYRGDIGGSGNLLPMWQAAIGRRGNSEMMAGAFGGGGGLSTITVPGILSNSANKFLMDQFLGGEQSWRQIAKIRTANDFKAMTFYRLTGANKFIKIPPGGEIQHGTLTELSHTLQVDTYGLQLGVTRTDFINDDLGAFAGRSGELGRGAIDSLNEVFYTEMLEDSTFFPIDKSLLNYDDGATDSVLSLAGLENADSIFASQTKPDGTPFGKTPKLLIVPRGLRARASTLVKATGLVGQGLDAAAVPDDNPWSGMFTVVDSVYLQSSAITGYSTTAWYLACNPNDASFIEVAFLNGRDTPIIEESELEWNRLGMSMRAYWDWGCNKSEYRAANKMKGAA